MSTQAPAAPRRRLPTWAVVLVTLGCVVGVGVVFVAGIAVGVVLGRQSAQLAGGALPTPLAGPVAPAPAPGEPPAGTEGSAQGATQEPGDDGPVPTGEVDPCLVGSWRTVEHEESYRTEQGPASLTGLVRDVEITAEGRQTIRYAGSEATITTDVGALPAVFDGTVEYVVRTDGGTMSFTLESSEGTVTVRGPGGQEQVEDLQAGAGDVSYTCDDERFTQTAEGFRAVYERVG